VGVRDERPMLRCPCRANWGWGISGPQALPGAMLRCPFGAEDGVGVRDERPMLRCPFRAIGGGGPLDPRRCHRFRDHDSR